MKERPILFSAPMVRALLDGRKTQTRRVIKPQPVQEEWLSRCPYGVPGDRLWVKETWGLSAHFDDTDWLRGSVKGRSQDDVTESWKLRFAADYEGPMSSEYPYWRPSIFMPRWASRLTFEVTEVRVERVQDISNTDAIAEGLIPVGGPNGQQMWAYSETTGGHFGDPCVAFQMLWHSINGAESWDANPWVWVVGFKVVT